MALSFYSCSATLWLPLPTPVTTRYQQRYHELSEILRWQEKSFNFINMYKCRLSPVSPLTTEGSFPGPLISVLVPAPVQLCNLKTRGPPDPALGPCIQSTSNLPLLLPPVVKAVTLSYRLLTVTSLALGFCTFSYSKVQATFQKANPFTSFKPRVKTKMLKHRQKVQRPDFLDSQAKLQVDSWSPCPNSSQFLLFLGQAAWSHPSPLLNTPSIPHCSEPLPTRARAATLHLPWLLSVTEPDCKSRWQGVLLCLPSGASTPFKGTQQMSAALLDKL